jgi:hypothetical protein
MPNYRFYTANYMNAPDFVECASDQEAISRAKQLLNGSDIEVWQGTRIIIRLRTSDAKLFADSKYRK